MPIHTAFLPAERLSGEQMEKQSRLVGENPTLIAMLDISPTMVALVNAERQIVFCNDACAKAGGLAHKKDAVGMRAGELLHCVHAAEQPGGCGTSESCRYCGLVQALVVGKKDTTNSGECLLQCDDGAGSGSAEYAVEVKPLPELCEGWQCYSLRDISAEKRREALERTFFHDIMNRASAVEGVSTVLAGEQMPQEEQAEFIEMLSTSAHALVEEIRSQRMLLSAEQGDLSVVKAEVDSLTALHDAVAACRSFGFAQDKRLVVQHGAVSMAFETDAALLGRVLINLLKNALEASETSATVTAACGEIEPGLVRFSVHNDAVMSDDVRAHVFTRSFSTKGAGRGLGTYSIRLLTESYLGGKAWFESKPGVGTTFHVEFRTQGSREGTTPVAVIPSKV
ncbi:sensor histidine kinase [Paludibaculum fermentans]|uniref:sensor histidine kinase n=1 Tax=Paludibaculum fermentans TaxID=1473598 RepID=UPI003EB93924